MTFGATAVEKGHGGVGGFEVLGFDGTEEGRGGCAPIGALFLPEGDFGIGGIEHRDRRLLVVLGRIQAVVDVAARNAELDASAELTVIAATPVRAEDSAGA